MKVGARPHLLLLGIFQNIAYARKEITNVVRIIAGNRGSVGGGAFRSPLSLAAWLAPCAMPLPASWG